MDFLVFACIDKTFMIWEVKFQNGPNSTSLCVGRKHDPKAGPLKRNGPKSRTNSGITLSIRFIGKRETWEVSPTSQPHPLLQRQNYSTLTFSFVRCWCTINLIHFSTCTLYEVHGQRPLLWLALECRDTPTPRRAQDCCAFLLECHGRPLMFRRVCDCCEIENFEHKYEQMWK